MTLVVAGGGHEKKRRRGRIYLTMLRGPLKAFLEHTQPDLDCLRRCRTLNSSALEPLDPDDDIWEDQRRSRTSRPAADHDWFERNPIHRWLPMAQHETSSTRYWTCSALDQATSHGPRIVEFDWPCPMGTKKQFLPAKQEQSVSERLQAVDSTGTNTVTVKVN